MTRPVLLLVSFGLRECIKASLAALGHRYPAPGPAMRAIELMTERVAACGPHPKFVGPEVFEP